MATSPPPFSPFSGLAPQRKDKSTFSDRFDAFITWFIAAVANLPALALNVYNNALEAFQSAGTATAAASAAMASSNAAPWVSGTTYAQSARAISQVNFQVYTRRIAGAGTTDPSSDSTNWVLSVGNATNGAFVPVAVTAADIDLRLGNYFTKSVTSNTTLTISNCPSDGYSFTLKLTLTSGAVVLPTNVYVQSNIATVMNTGKVHRLVFITEDRGAHWAMVVASNFDF